MYLPVSSSQWDCGPRSSPEKLPRTGVVVDKSRAKREMESRRRARNYRPSSSGPGSGRGSSGGSREEDSDVQRVACSISLPCATPPGTTLSLLGGGHHLVPMDEPSSSDSSGFRNPFKKRDASTFDACKDRGTDSPFQPYSMELIKKFVEQPSSLVKPAAIDRDQSAEQRATPQVPMMPQKEFVETLSLLTHRISFLQNLVPMIYQERGTKEGSSHLQMVAASGLATVVSHLSTISASLLPYLTAQGPPNHPSQTPSPSIKSSGQLGSVFDAFHPASQEDKAEEEPPVPASQDQDQKDELQSLDLLGGVHKDSLAEEDEDMETEKLDPGTYELVEMDAVEILAEHTHFCEICGKGFKRDANLRMHMRGHGDEYKTPAALARPDKPNQGVTVPTKIRRYSCPYVGCKRNKCHKKFVPLKTMLCVKNHYRRSHCPKMLTCSKCRTKKFSVVADLKTHEKHCGKDKWMCSCGTTFSRKDKLIGHLSLFTGHISATPLGSFSDGSISGIESIRMDGSEEVKSFHDRHSFPSLTMPSSHEVHFRNLTPQGNSNTNRGHKLKMENDFFSDVSLSLGSVHSQRTQEGRLQNFFS